jgi:hypothetical protein
MVVPFTHPDLAPLVHALACGGKRGNASPVIYKSLLVYGFNARQFFTFHVL